jgi:hypothetical protein
VGLLSTAVRDVRTGRFERTLAGLTAAGAAVTAGEIFFSHDGASFGNRVMWWPVAVVPTAVPAGIAAVFSERAARTVLPAVSALYAADGLVGVVTHLRGVHRKPGGLRNTTYNLVMGPPLLAPGALLLIGGFGMLAPLMGRER